MRSVGNSMTLFETKLVEAFNLKAAIEYVMRNAEGAQEALADMPPRSEHELDHVTLHNRALCHMETDPTGGFHKFVFLLQNPPFPPETFGNLLLLYCKHGFYDMAADVMAEYSVYKTTHVSEELLAFLDALIMRQTSPEEAYKKLDALAGGHVDVLRKLTKQIQDARMARDNDLIKRCAALGSKGAGFFWGVFVGNGGAAVSKVRVGGEGDLGGGVHRRLTNSAYQNRQTLPPPAPSRITTRRWSDTCRG